MTGPSTVDLVARIEDLQARSAHQERILEELNDVVAAQWKQIDVLTRKLEQMKEQLEEAVEPRPGNTPEPPPPHY